MSDDERRAVANLVIFCDPHHDRVDKKANEKIFPVETLVRWKAQIEADPHEAVRRLREVSPEGLRKIVSEGLEQHDTLLVRAIDRLEESDRQAANLMRDLIDELTEAYSLQRRRLNPDLVEELSSASRRLYAMSGMIETFDNAVRRAERLQWDQ
ncbi:hypothetical protein J4573_41575 [Actinomadura barringtoniae]|uniref:Uncharacterized protein n=1 Tax=Actinomadura barringtoniae TaxID=1427535 RepID=A0A939T7Z9_9ACTN|nr:hypothetical protein [Actinomadura barringtoniae]MBO2453638.1 hypothetical protein [Actinomadura barringtoniae]